MSIRSLMLVHLLLITVLVLAACGKPPAGPKAEVAFTSLEASQSSEYRLAGSISPVRELEAAEYSLNSQDALPLTVSAAGSFAVDLELIPGLNTVVLTVNMRNAEPQVFSHEINYESVPATVTFTSSAFSTEADYLVTGAVAATEEVASATIQWNQGEPAPLQLDAAGGFAVPMSLKPGVNDILVSVLLPASLEAASVQASFEVTYSSAPLAISVASDTFTADVDYDLIGNVSPESALAGLTFSLNDAPVVDLATDSTGAFRSTVQLEPGRNELLLSAVSKTGVAISHVHTVHLVAGADLATSSNVAAIGDSLTLHSAGLFGMAPGEVTIGGVPATIVDWSEGEITVTLSAGTPGGYVDVQVSTRNGNLQAVEIFVGMVFGGPAAGFQAFVNSQPVGTTVLITDNLDLRGSGETVLRQVNLIGAKDSEPPHIQADTLRFIADSKGALLANLELSAREHHIEKAPAQLGIAAATEPGTLLLHNLTLNAPDPLVQQPRIVMGRLVGSELRLVMDSVNINAPYALVDLSGASVDLQSVMIDAGHLTISGLLHLDVSGGSMNSLTSITLQSPGSINLETVSVTSNDELTVQSSTGTITLADAKITAESLALTAAAGNFEVLESDIRTLDAVHFFGSDAYGADRFIGNTVDGTGIVIGTQSASFMFDGNTIDLDTTWTAAVIINMQAAPARPFTSSFSDNTINMTSELDMAVFTIDTDGPLEFHHNEIMATTPEEDKFSLNAPAGLRVTNNSITMGEAVNLIGGGERDAFRGNTFTMISAGDFEQEFTYDTDADFAEFVNNTLTLITADWDQLARINLGDAVNAQITGNTMRLDLPEGVDSHPNQEKWVRITATVHVPFLKATTIPCSTAAQTSLLPPNSYWAPVPW